MYASQYGRTEIVRYLISQSEININYNTDGILILLYNNIQYQHLFIKFDLILYLTALIMAINLGHIEVVSILLSHPKIDINKKNI